MALPRLFLIEHPGPEHRAAILHLLRRYNTSSVGEPVAESFAIVLRHPESNALIGGLWGSLALDWLFVDLIFVPQEFRLRGLGSSMMRTVEEIARRRGCVGIQLNTFSFEAPGFYEKNGYQIFGRLENCPRGHQRIYYFKMLHAAC